MRPAISHRPTTARAQPMVIGRRGSTRSGSLPMAPEAMAIEPLKGRNDNPVVSG